MKIVSLLALVALVTSCVFNRVKVEKNNPIAEVKLMEHSKELASDKYEGRAPGSKGGELAQDYIASQYQAMGLRPPVGMKDYRQKFTLVGITSNPPKSVTIKGKKNIRLKYHKDYIAISGLQGETAQVTNAPLVYVGYGIQAPEYKWDDYKGVSVKGKVLVMLNNDPDWDEDLFAGSRRLYYGRWTYKWEIAEKLGAIGAIIIHTTPSAGYGWSVVDNSWSREQFELPKAKEAQTMPLKGWVTKDAANEIFKSAKIDLAEAKVMARSREFRPMDLPLKLSIKLKNKIRKINSANVLGVVGPNDGQRNYVVYSAHYDHLGKGGGMAQGKDDIYNGARDNAAAVASLLELARVIKAQSQNLGRPVLFAAVGAEEYGLLGSKHLANSKIIDSKKTVFNINLEMVNTWGKTRDVRVVGLGLTSVDADLVRVAKVLGREVKQERFPDQGFFYRSDQFSFAKVGVPAVWIGTGIDFIGKDKNWGVETIDKWRNTHYHQVTDEVDETWDVSGLAEDLHLMYELGKHLSVQSELPQWSEGVEFKR